MSLAVKYALLGLLCVIASCAALHASSGNAVSALYTFLDLPALAGEDQGKGIHAFRLLC
jgi:hypothetical protein